jgi:hypothetical protein
MGPVRGSSVLVVVALGASTLLGACGDADDLVAAGPLGEASIAPAGRTLVPSDLPDGMTLHLVDPDSGGWADGFVRLYGDAEAVDPAEGPLVVAMWQWFDGDGSLPTGEPRYSVPPSELDSFGGQEVVTGGEGPVGWMTWLVPNGTEDPGSTGVVARGLTEDELHSAAGSLEIDAGGELVGDLRLDDQPPGDDTWRGGVRLTEPPPGLVELAAGRLSFSGLDVGNAPSPGSVLQWRREDARLTVATYEHDDALALLLRAGVDDPDGTEIRGHAGAHGPAFAPSAYGDNMPSSDLWTWTEDGMDVVVIARGMDAATAQRAVDSLRPSTDWDALTAEASAPPSREAGPDEILIQEGFAGGSWSVSITCRPADASGHNCERMADIRHADGSHGLGGGGSVTTDAAWIDVAGDDDGTLVDGTVPASIEAVEVELADGTVLRPELHDGGEDWPIRAWALWVSDAEAVVTDLRGFDSAGRQRFTGVAAELADLGQPLGAGSGAGTRITVAD